MASSPTLKRGSVGNLALDRAAMLQIVEQSRREAAVAFAMKPQCRLGQGKPPLGKGVHTASYGTTGGGSPWMGSMNRSNPCSPWSAWRPSRKISGRSSSWDPCSPPSSRVGLSTPKRLSVGIADGPPSVHVIDPTSPCAMSPAKRSLISTPSSITRVDTSRGRVTQLAPTSPTAPSSGSSDDSEPISKSQPLGRCPLGLKQSGKAAVLPAVPPAILGKMRRVKTWPPPEIPLGSAGDTAEAHLQSDRQAEVPDETDELMTKLLPVEKDTEKGGCNGGKSKVLDSAVLLVEEPQESTRIQLTAAAL